ncbi:DNA-binding transcriptional regulator, PadR family [Halorubrum aquaticum]|uniref:DNA-binding transcriptional regulator, PadR family n=1 Tax=Halorubrum aquaticum TaxID=387340 RepID=A0A1I3BFV6_9EURY|nr:PadR family transcriptional regulator [Halorubrum aquaticum]SFH61168.1 DNA-binding transcriptional regulator, PadR family [Halorubrum aquaticum]
MTKWFHSGRRRDCCVLVYEAGELRAQSLKSRLESHYDERIDPQSFYATLSALVEAGYLTRRAEGLADVYTLTDAGEVALLDHYEWISERVAAGNERIDEGGNDADGIVGNDDDATDAGVDDANRITGVDDSRDDAE